MTISKKASVSFLLLGTLITAAAALAQSPPLSFKAIELGKTSGDELSEKYKGLAKQGVFLKATAVAYVDALCGSAASSPSRKAEWTRCRNESSKDVRELFRVGDTSEATLDFIVIDDRVEYVGASFSTEDYHKVTSALEEKYGPPKQSWASDVQDLKTGAKFKSVTKAWVVGGGMIFANQKKHDDLDKMLLRLQTKKMIEWDKEQGAKRAKENAKGL